MSDDTKSNLSEANSKKGQLSVIKMEARKRLKSILADTSSWDIPEQIIQEIIASTTAAGSDPSNTQLVDFYHQYIKDKYEDNAEVYKLLQECAPSAAALGFWKKKKGWEEAVWDYLKNSNLFSKENRASMIRALYERGLAKDTVAAKIWLTLSGDYSDKMEVKTDEKADKFREINEILHRKT